MTWLRAGLLVVVCACSGGDDVADTDHDTDTDTDTDTDSDTDSDTDADTDSDTDADTDTDSDTHTDSGSWDPADFDFVYEVGPGQDYEDPSAVPWESLAPSSLVRIHWRDTPYRSKWVIASTATAEEPIVVTGVPDGGRLPVISGDGATTRRELDYWNEDRSVIKIGGASTPSERPAYITVANLDIRSARPAYSFTDDSGRAGTYRSNAASVHIEAGDHITIQGCELHDSGNGLFSGSDSSEVVVRGNIVYDNGIDGSFYEHNSYTESLGIVFEGNHYGPLRAGCLGNNLKDRSGGTVIRYNRIEGGNRALDLVESGHEAITGDPRYRSTFVYGNVLVELDDGGNSQILHYGGDGSGVYRGGTLHLFHNTIVSERAGNTTLVRLSSAGESADIRNNVIVGARLAILGGEGSADLGSNWLSTGWREAFSGAGAVSDNGNVTGEDAALDADYRPTSASPFLGGAGSAHPGTSAHPVLRHFADPGTEPRVSTDDLGAFEH